MSEAVYALCALTSALCAVLLVRAYLRQRASLLLWSSICFVGLTASSALLFFDLVVVPDRDLSLYRALASALSTGVLAISLAWRSRTP
jgi:hypothetical protein